MVTCLVAGATGAVGQQIVRLLVTNMAVSSVVVLTRRAVPAAGEAAAVAWAREHLGLTEIELAKKIIAVHVSEADWEHDDASMSALDVMARDFAVREQAWLQTLLQTPAPAALVQVMNGVDVVFTAMGSSRANSETQAAQAATSYHEGFATWLRRVDCSQNIKLAQAARAANAKGLVRVSAMSSNAKQFGTPEQYWGWCESFHT
jgi:aspartate-semialdehyde dehydrogenase